MYERIEKAIRDLEYYSSLKAATKKQINEISNKHSSNFIAIDEGFGCFDKNNIKNIESIFDVMKKHYKFVTILSAVFRVNTN